jgi:meiotic recombination protein SPO11
MDFDLFSNLLRDDPGPSSGSLLSNLPHRSPTDDSRISSCNTSSHISSSQPNIANTPDPSQTGRVITKIENIFESITDCILDQKKELIISLRSRPRCKSKNSEESTSNPKPKLEIKNITFPSKSPQEAWKFSELKMIDSSHKLIWVQRHCSEFSNSLMKL